MLTLHRRSYSQQGETKPHQSQRVFDRLKLFKPPSSEWKEVKRVWPQHSWQKANVTQTLYLTSFWLCRCVRWSLASSCLCCYVPPPPCWPNPANRWLIGPQWTSVPTLPESCLRSRYSASMSAAIWIKPVDRRHHRLPYPKPVLCTPVEILDGASKLITIISGLEAVPLQQQQQQHMTTGKENNQVSNDLLDNKCSSDNKAVRHKQLWATGAFMSAGNVYITQGEVAINVMEHFCLHKRSTLLGANPGLLQ